MSSSVSIRINTDRIDWQIELVQEHFEMASGCYGKRFARLKVKGVIRCGCNSPDGKMSLPARFALAR
jgi:hypothetical protein